MGFGDDLLDPAGVDPAIGHQALHREARHLAAHRIEAGEDHGLRRVVHDDIDAGDRLEGPDVSPLTPDDPALHVVARQRDDRHGGLGSVVDGQLLDGLRDDLLGCPLGLPPRLLLQVANAPGRLCSRLILDSPDELLSSFFSSQAGDLLELAFQAR